MLEPFSALISVMSTIGNGEAPVNAQPFIRMLRRLLSEGKVLSKPLRVALLGMLNCSISQCLSSHACLID
jgi:sulfite reductase alpha subunit-like flavoprotein